jgi:hypothetical protein
MIGKVMLVMLVWNLFVLIGSYFDGIFIFLILRFISLIHNSIFIIFLVIRVYANLILNLYISYALQFSH